MLLDCDVINASKTVKSVNSEDVALYDGDMSNILCSHTDLNCIGMYGNVNSISNAYSVYHETDSTGDHQYPLIQTHTGAVPCGGTNPKVHANASVILCTIGVTNVHWVDYVNTSVYYYVYLHTNPQKPPGFFFYRRIM